MCVSVYVPRESVCSASMCVPRACVVYHCVSGGVCVCVCVCVCRMRARLFAYDSVRD